MTGPGFNLTIFQLCVCHYQSMKELSRESHYLMESLFHLTCLGRKHAVSTFSKSFKSLTFWFEQFFVCVCFPGNGGTNFSSIDVQELHVSIRHARAARPCLRCWTDAHPSNVWGLDVWTCSGLRVFVKQSTEISMLYVYAHQRVQPGAVPHKHPFWNP